MRRNLVPLLIAALGLLGLALGWKMFAASEADRYVRTKAVRVQRTEIRLTYVVSHARGKISREEFTFTNIEGRSSASYAGTSRSGTTIARFTSPIKNYDVTYLFDQVVHDGIWELASKPPRGDTTTSYDIAIAQRAGEASGQHRFAFTDPHYWATTGGQQFRIHLDKTKPTPDLLQMKSTSLTEVRYGTIVKDFEAFGTPVFRTTLAKARARLASAG